MASIRPLRAFLWLLQLTLLVESQTTYDLELAGVWSGTSTSFWLNFLNLAQAFQISIKDMSVGDTWTKQNASGTNEIALLDVSSADGFARVKYAVDFLTENLDGCDFEYTFTVPLTAGSGQSPNVPVTSCFAKEAEVILQLDAILTVIANAVPPTVSPFKAPTPVPSSLPTGNEAASSNPVATTGPISEPAITREPSMSEMSPAESTTTEATSSATSCAVVIVTMLAAAAGWCVATLG